MEASNCKDTWDSLASKEGHFSFHSSPPEANQIITKRSFLRTIATLFDPLGFLAPFIIRAKLVMQEIWRKGFDWDEELDGEVKSKVQSWYSDASEEAYGAVVYASMSMSIMQSPPLLSQQSHV